MMEVYKVLKEKFEAAGGDPAKFETVSKVCNFEFELTCAPPLSPKPLTLHPPPSTTSSRLLNRY